MSHYKQQRTHEEIQFILMASFVLGTCQLAVLSGAADEPDVKESNRIIQ